MKNVNIIIPQKHQASPSQRFLYDQNRLGRGQLYSSELGLNESDLLRSLNVKPSIIHGLGLFASKDFGIHDLIWYESLNGRSSSPQEEGPLRWTNHSDDPNSILVLGQNGIMNVKLVAVKKISLGDEITYNYNVFGHEGYKAKCNCGNRNCQGYFLMRTEWGERK